MVKEVKGFKCENCRKLVSSRGQIGTAHRNHCPHCLWSKHVDEGQSGDRMSGCRGPMRPVGLTFKHEGLDKYTGKPKVGELMLVHQCLKCAGFSINRLAADDEAQVVLQVFEDSLAVGEIAGGLVEEGIDLLTEKARAEIRKQLFGAGA